MATEKRFLVKSGLDNNTKTITNVAAPVADTDAANMAFAKNAGNLSTGTMSASRLPALTGGDVTSSSGSAVLTLATVNTDVGTFGTSTAIPVITVNGKGLITSASTTAISTTVNLSGNTGTGSVAGGGTLTLTGSNNLTTSISGSTVTITDSVNPSFTTVTTTGNAAINGGSLTTTSATGNLFNTNATTVNLGGAATSINIGNASNTTEVVIKGNLTIDGTTTTINSTTLTVDDKTIVIGSGSANNAAASGAGITVESVADGNKTFNWLDSAYDAWTSSENMELASGKSYYINGTQVLSSTQLGTGVTLSSLTTVGTITSGTWNGSVIGSSYGGAGSVSGVLKANGSGTVSAASGTDITTLIGANYVQNATSAGSADNLTLANETASSSYYYPTMVASTGGAAQSVYISNTKIQFKPSTGEIRQSNTANIKSNKVVSIPATGGSPLTIDTFTGSGAKYVISCYKYYNGIGGAESRNIVELLINVDGKVSARTVDITEYGSLGSSYPLITFDATINQSTNEVTVTAIGTESSPNTYSVIYNRVAFDLMTEA